MDITVFSFQGNVIGSVEYVLRSRDRTLIEECKKEFPSLHILFSEAWDSSHPLRYVNSFSTREGEVENWRCAASKRLLPLFLSMSCGGSSHENKVGSRIYVQGNVFYSSIGCPPASIEIHGEKVVNTTRYHLVEL
jgi:hypothetical protein